MLALLAEAAASPENGKWLAHDKNEIIWGTLAFFVVVALLMWKAAPAIRKAMTGRTERIQAELDAATLQRTEAEGERDRIKAALADSDAEASRIVADAHETAAKLKENIAERTVSEIALLRERASADIDATRRQSLADLTGDVSRLSLGAAEQLVEHNLGDDAQQSLIESYIARVGVSN